MNAAQERLHRLLARIDAMNSADPNTDTVDGKPYPRELLYAQRLSDWVRKLEPKPSEEMLIAARGQHVCRWTVPRDSYERNRKGYLRWREDLKTFHADTVAALMREEGYTEEKIEHLRKIIRKRDFKDPATQTVEDALCLVFLQTQFEDLFQKTQPDKMAEILRKTWSKMSERGKKAALALDLPARHKEFIVQSLG